MLEINSTVFIQIANFLLLVLLLNILVFRPIRGILRRRQEETRSLEGGIGEYRGRALEAERGVEEGRIAARRDGFARKEALKTEAQKEEKVILQEAGASVEAKLGTAKEEMETEMAKVRKALDKQITGFSNELAEKILGRSIQ